MPLDDKALQAIKNREEGWRKYFEELFLQIERRLKWLAPQVDKFNLLKRNLPDQIERDHHLDDFIAWLYLKYYQDAQAGNLIGDDITAENANYKLASKQFIGWKISDYFCKYSGLSGWKKDKKGRKIVVSLTDLGKDQEGVEEESIENNTHEAAPGDRHNRPGASEEGLFSQPFTPEKHSPHFDFDNIALSLPDNLGKVEEQAGVQLYPRLDWTLPPHKPLMQLLEQLIKNCHAVLKHCHDIEYEKHAGRIKKIEEELFNGGQWPTELAKKRFDTRQTKYVFEMVFAPLSADTLCSILDIQADYAYQLRKRYKDALPELLSEYKKFLPDS